MWSAGQSETRFTGKLIASLTTCHSTSSGTSGEANGRATRKQTSVNGSRRNSSSSCGKCRAISTGMYRPPSGARPRSTAPRSEVSGALREVLRYLNEFRSSQASRFARNHFQEREGVQRSISQRGDLQRAMRERFITLAPRGNQNRITTPHCFRDRKSTRLNSSHDQISYAVFCLKKKKSKRLLWTIIIRGMLALRRVTVYTQILCNSISDV